MNSPSPYSPYSPQGLSVPYGASPSTKKPLWKKWWFWLITVLVILLIAFVGVFGFAFYVIEKEENNAVSACQDYVVGKAKYPGGVEFPESDGEISTETNELGNTLYTIKGEVDFPNGWGTPVRHSYHCAIQVDTLGEVLTTTGRVYK